MTALGGGGGDEGGSLEETIPGVPGEDYPINAEVPDTGFSCDGRVKQPQVFVVFKHPGFGTTRPS